MSPYTHFTRKGTRMRTVLVLMDTLRRDALGCYNPEGAAQTPCLDAFAQDSVVFDNHWIGSRPPRHHVRPL